MIVGEHGIPDVDIAVLHVQRVVAERPAQRGVLQREVLMVDRELAAVEDTLQLILRAARQLEISDLAARSARRDFAPPAPLNRQHKRSLDTCLLQTAASHRHYGCGWTYQHP